MILSVALDSEGIVDLDVMFSLKCIFKFQSDIWIHCFMRQLCVLLCVVRVRCMYVLCLCLCVFVVLMSGCTCACVCMCMFTVFCVCMCVCVHFCVCVCVEGVGPLF